MLKGEFFFSFSPSLFSFLSFLPLSPLLKMSCFLESDFLKEGINYHYNGVCSVAQSCLTICSPMDWAYKAPLSMEFSKQEYWSGLPLPIPGDLLMQRSNPCLLHLLHLQVDSLPLEPLGKHRKWGNFII